VAADPAVLDANQDGLLDTIYIATTAGFLYKMDVSKAAALQTTTIDKSKFLPALAANASVKRVTDTAWAPFKIFDTGGRPIFFAPTAFFVSSLNLFALTFGTGDRENLWNLTGQVGRYYLIVDESYTASTLGLPKTEANYKVLSAAAADVDGSPDFVLSPSGGNNRGWVLTLDANERVITQAFGLSGVLIFSTYEPQIVISGSGASVSCASSGTSRVFVVLTSNANSVMKVQGLATRYTTVPEFVTNPFVEQGATRNSPAANRNSEQLDATQQGIFDTLKSFYPKNTKFANYWISVSGVRSDTGYIRYATIPIGIVVKNWKEY
jgi:Tfp pilus tip-associated adhesin PilY1